MGPTEELDKEATERALGSLIEHQVFVDIPTAAAQGIFCSDTQAPTSMWLYMAFDTQGRQRKLCAAALARPRGRRHTTVGMPASPPPRRPCAAEDSGES